MNADNFVFKEGDIEDFSFLGLDPADDFWFPLMNAD